MRASTPTIAATVALLLLVPAGGAAAGTAGGSSPAPVESTGQDAGDGPAEGPAEVPDEGPAGGTDDDTGDSAGAARANTAPVTVADTAEVVAPRRVRVDVLANDTDAEGDPLTVVATAGGGGRMSTTGEDVVFDARGSDRGRFELTYTVSDGSLTSTGDLVVRVRPQPRTVTLRVPRPLVALRTHRVRGEVAPRSAGRAEVRLQRRTGDRWRPLGSARSRADGSWSVPFRTNDPGPRVLRAVATWPDARVARSASVRRTVVARADARISGPLTRAAVPHSWRPGCPVGPSGLRRLTITFWNYRGTVSRGTVIARRGAVQDLAKVFDKSLTQGFPIRRMQPSDVFYAGGRRTPTQSDKAAMRAGNTSAFNCRPVTGNPYRVSQHSYGNAVDINTIENPYVVGSTVYPAGSRGYLDRSPYRRGMILAGGVVATTMRNLGWPWGARWTHPDYQHFSSNGG